MMFLQNDVSTKRCFYKTMFLQNDTFYKTVFLQSVFLQNAAEPRQPKAGR